MRRIIETLPSGAHIVIDDEACDWHIDIPARPSGSSGHFYALANATGVMRDHGLEHGLLLGHSAADCFEHIPTRGITRHRYYPVEETA